MGLTICPCLKFNKKSRISNIGEQLPNTQRPLTYKVSSSPQTLQTLDNKIENSVNKTYKQSHEKSQRYLSTVMNSTDCDKNVSTLCSATYNPSSIFLIKSKIRKRSHLKKQDYYMLIDGVSYIKKQNLLITVQSPSGQAKLNCLSSNIDDCLFITQGIPKQCIAWIDQTKFIWSGSSPISTKIIFQCRTCQKRMIYTSSLSLIKTESIFCGLCERNQWSVLNIQSNFPIWGEGKKIESGVQLQISPRYFRIMGCISCFRFDKCQKLECGCLICQNCKHKQNKCDLCEEEE